MNNFLQILLTQESILFIQPGLSGLFLFYQLAPDILQL